MTEDESFVLFVGVPLISMEHFLRAVEDHVQRMKDVVIPQIEEDLRQQREYAAGLRRRVF